MSYSCVTNRFWSPCGLFLPYMEPPYRGPPSVMRSTLSIRSFPVKTGRHSIDNTERCKPRIKEWRLFRYTFIALSDFGTRMFATSSWLSEFLAQTFVMPSRHSSFVDRASSNLHSQEYTDLFLFFFRVNVHQSTVEPSQEISTFQFIPFRK